MGELIVYEWKECPPELLGMKTAKTAERAEYLRWSDFTILVAYRSKGREACCVVKHPEKGQSWGNGETWIHNTKERRLELIVQRWAADIDQ